MSFLLKFSLITVALSCCLAGFAEEELPERKPLPSKEEIAALPPDGGAGFNRLIFEKSPYLLQHARNPVDWYPWGDEAFLKAEAEDKLIFLSIGYSTCHWCHVMEAESFEDEEVANLLNRDYVCIKIDREERPDLDDYFMKVTTAFTQQGGWPNTLFLTPNRSPIFATTYIPKNEKYGRPGLMQVLPQMTSIWTTQRERVTSQLETISTLLQKANQAESGSFPTQDILDDAYAKLKRSFDPEYGGFGNAPKFPTPHNMTFLLRYWKRSQNQEALQIVKKTLTNMRLGGIFDHVGYGFHRYSTDRQWLIPHFEKMLYDQALIANAYLETFQESQNPLYQQTAHEIFTYVLRDMTDPKGGFYSAEDADSDGGEGNFYLWTAQEARNVLGTEDGNYFNSTFGIREEGNWTEVQDEKKNIVHLRSLANAIKTDNDIFTVMYALKWDKIRLKLFEAREKREHPLKDDKILCDWNGLMIAALAKGGNILESDAYTDAAVKAADFILKEMRKEDGRLFHRYRNGHAGIDGMLDDYAFFVWGLLELYETTFDAKYLSVAQDLSKIMLEDFGDDAHGALYMTNEKATDLPVRPISSYDGAVPSGNSVAMINLIRLGRMTANYSFEEAANNIAKAFSERLKNSPNSQTQLLQALDFAYGPSFEVVIVGDKKAEDTKAMLAALNKNYIPNKVVILKDSEDSLISELAPFTLGHESVEGKATAYVCKEFACELPTTDVKKMLELLGVKEKVDPLAAPLIPNN